MSNIFKKIDGKKTGILQQVYCSEQLESSF